MVPIPPPAAAVPHRRGHPGDRRSLSPTKTVVLSVVLTNRARSTSPASGHLTLAPPADRGVAADHAGRRVGLGRAPSVSLSPVTFAVKPGDSYQLTVAVDGARRARPARPASSLHRDAADRPGYLIRAARAASPRDPSGAVSTAAHVGVIGSAGPPNHQSGTGGVAHVAESITITDNRTGESIEIPISTAGSRPREWSKLLPGCGSTTPASCRRRPARAPSPTSTARRGSCATGATRSSSWPRSRPTWRWPTSSSTASCPTTEQFAAWRNEITNHTFIHENVRKRFLEGFHYDAHPMGMLVSAVAALSTFYLDAKEIFDPESRNKQIIRLIAKMPTLAAAAHRFSVGMPFVYPDNSLDFADNFLSMMWKVAEPRYEADPVLAHALDVLFILHADHEQNCSTTAMRVVGSSHADPYSATAAAAAALYGPRHGGANEAVIRMLTEIGSIDNVPEFIDSVKAGPGRQRLQGFGHRVYKSYDPRAKIIKQTADEVFEVTGKNPLLDIALKLEEIALTDEYFTSRHLYPNVDFYSGLIYQAMGFPLEMFPVLFAIPRTVGWLAHWQEMLDQDSKIARPRQLYIGQDEPGLRPHRRTLGRSRPLGRGTPMWHWPHG